MIEENRLYTLHTVSKLATIMQHLDADIPYFLAVVKQSSFAGAARELGVSRSAVNKRVIN
ncbi:LysR family transcriptional regulator [Vibrio lentus]|nr:LysR family transcriptional regulator [Vibrio lentus]